MVFALNVFFFLFHNLRGMGFFFPLSHGFIDIFFAFLYRFTFWAMGLDATSHWGLNTKLRGWMGGGGGEE
jgi:hypothetical protein